MTNKHIEKTFKVGGNFVISKFSNDIKTEEKIIPNKLIWQDFWDNLATVINENESPKRFGFATRNKIVNGGRLVEVLTERNTLENTINFVWYFEYEREMLEKDDTSIPDDEKFKAAAISIYENNSNTEYMFSNYSNNSTLIDSKTAFSANSLIAKYDIDEYILIFHDEDLELKYIQTKHIDEKIIFPIKGISRKIDSKTSLSIEAKYVSVFFKVKNNLLLFSTAKLDDTTVVKIGKWTDLFVTCSYSINEVNITPQERIEQKFKTKLIDYKNSTVTNTVYTDYDNNTIEYDIIYKYCDDKYSFDIIYKYNFLNLIFDINKNPRYNNTPGIYIIKIDKDNKQLIFDSCKHLETVDDLPEKIKDKVADYYIVKVESDCFRDDIIYKTGKKYDVDYIKKIDISTDKMIPIDSVVKGYNHFRISSSNIFYDANVVCNLNDFVLLPRYVFLKFEEET